ncbi:MAG TPA: hypothetical protein DHU59_09850 [Clostridiales bacterium]|nr:hypothetical protein [Clostridiales bacterium]
MKKIITLALCLFLLLFSMTGCGGGNAEQKTVQEPQKIEEADKELEEAMNDLGEALSLLATPGWPKGKISDYVPEYPYGEVTNSGDGGDGEYFILISPTNEDELSEYLSLLENQGFTVSGDDEARSGTLNIRFQFNTKETLQMIVFDVGTSDWPDFIGDVLKPEKGTIYDEAYIRKVSSDENSNGLYYSAGFSLIDLSEEDCYEYIARHSDNGWRESGDMAFKDVTIDGIECELMLQFVQYYDGVADFLIEAWRK